MNNLQKDEVKATPEALRKKRYVRKEQMKRNVVNFKTLFIIGFSAFTSIFIGYWFDVQQGYGMLMGLGVTIFFYLFIKDILLEFAK